jgi:hypothetical protein
MKSKMILVSGIAALGVFGAGTAIGWSATNGSHPATTSKTKPTPMHSVADMRTHMQAMHPSLSKSQIDQLVADCQKALANGSMPGDMMGGGGMMGNHAAHHSRTTTGGMMGRGMMG